MNIKPNNGCYLTQSKDVPFSERKFLERLLVSSMEELSEWKEVTAQEKREMEERETFFAVENVDMNYLHKVDSVILKVSKKINYAQLSNDDAIEMTKYYPTWESLMGKQVPVGYRLQYDGLLLEVVEPHIVSEETRPQLAQPMAMAMTEETPTVYYRQVLPTQTK